VDLTQVGTEQCVERVPKFEFRLVLIALVPNRRQRSNWRGPVSVQVGQRCFDLDVALVDLGAMKVVDL
jgi:hypothetical protein